MDKANPTSPSRQPTLRQLRAFQSVAKRLSFRGAAQHLAVSQPALSSAIQELESLFGCALFERGPRKVGLTAAGRILLPQAEWLLNNFHHSVDDMHRSLASLSLSLRVGILPSLLHIGIPALAAWQQEFPSVRLILHDVLNRDMVAQLQSGELDIGLGAETELPDSISAVDVGRDELVAVVPPTHRLTQMKRVTWQDLQSERLATFTSMSTYEFAMSVLKQEGLHLNLEHQMLYRESILMLVRHGMAVGVMSRLYLHDASEQRLSTVRLHKPIMSRRLVLMRREGDTAVRTAASSCYSHLRKALREYKHFPVG